MKNTVHIFSLFLLSTTWNILPQAEQNTKKTPSSEHMQFIPEEILFVCKHHPKSKKCQEIFKHFYCAYKIAQGNLTEGEKQYFKQVDGFSDYSLDEKWYLTRYITNILECYTDATLEQITELIDKTLQAKEAMKKSAQNINKRK